MECDVYKSLKKENYYLYVVAGQALTRVPDALKAQFGDIEFCFSFDLHADRKLAKEDPETVLKNLEIDGYHLQLPPADERFHG